MTELDFDKLPFIKYHLAITRVTHALNQQRDMYPLEQEIIAGIPEKVEKMRERLIAADIIAGVSEEVARMKERPNPFKNTGFPTELRVEKSEHLPCYKDLQELLDQGAPWGWNRRAEYQDRSFKRELIEKLAQPTSALYTFWAGDTKIGSTVICNVEQNLESVFAKAAEDDETPIDLKPEWASQTREIYKIGLRPEFTAFGMGRYFVSQVFTDLFNSDPGLKVVYLNTRSTNHEGVVPFYTDPNKGLGMQVVAAKTYPSDILPRKEPKRKTEIATSLAASVPLTPNSAVA